MASPADHKRPRHRARGRRASRPLWTVLLVVVLLAAAAAVVHRVVTGGDDVADPVIALPAQASTEPTGFVHGVLTLTDGCFSIAPGLIVWPVGTTWDAATHTVDIVDTKAEWRLGDDNGMRATLVDAVPSASASVPQDVVDRLRRCADRTGIRSVAFVG